MNDDPDALVSVPAREVSAAVALVDALARLLDEQNSDSDSLADHLLAHLERDALSSLPEVGPLDGTESLRLHLHQLDARLRQVMPTRRTPLPRPPVVDSKPGPIPVRKPSRSAALLLDEEDQANASAFVWWDDITKEDVEHYREVLSSAVNEKPLQEHVALNPKLMVQHFRGGHGRWVISHKRLGSEYVPDFLIAERDSTGYEWQFVELQSPRATLFTKAGRATEQLDEGIRQILEWRRWLEGNRDYARRSRAQEGLGLPGISANSPGLLLIGREEALTEHDRPKRRQLDAELNIRIHTYDWLIRAAEARIEELSRWHAR